LTAEELLDSIQVAVTQKLDAQCRTYLDKASTPLTRALGRSGSHDEISTARSDDIAVVQALELLNGEELYERVYSGRLIDQALKEKDLAKVVDLVYRVALSRPATSQEQKLGCDYLNAALPELKRATQKPVEQVWLEDDLPEGAIPAGTGDAAAWKWVTQPDSPVFSGQRAHTQGGQGEQRQHRFDGAVKPLHVGPIDVLFAYVYLDPKAPPREIMLQWNNGGWDQRAFWGEDLISFGKPNTPSRRHFGPLPAAGQWVRLEVPAREIGIVAPTDIAGLSFDQYGGGAVYWDKSGVVLNLEDPARAPLGDVLWALFASPEFQYIR
jgi:hypothetical protein